MSKRAIIVAGLTTIMLAIGAGMGVPVAGAAASVSQDAAAEMDPSGGRGSDEFAWQNEFSIIATAIAEEHPEIFAGSTIEDQNSRRASIAFKGPAPEGILDRFAALQGVRIGITEGRQWSTQELDRDLETVHRAVAGRSDRIEALTSSYDPKTGAISIEAKPAPAEEELARNTGPSFVTDLIPTEFVPRVAHVELNPNLTTGADQMRGGARLEVTGGSGLACTAGFNVRNSSGVTGIATAGHCSNLLTAENVNGDPEYGTTFQREHRGSWGDFQWSITGTTEPDDFYYDFLAVRDVITYANPSVGQRLCHFGQATGAACSYVAYLSVCSSFGGYTHCRLVQMDRDVSNPGDSGGPWYYGNTAYGFHSGYVGSSDVWSRVGYIDDALGVTVLTS